MQQNKQPYKNRKKFKFRYGENNQYQVIFSSEFDSGNLATVVQNNSTSVVQSLFSIKLQPILIYQIYLPNLVLIFALVALSQVLELSLLLVKSIYQQIIMRMIQSVKKINIKFALKEEINHGKEVVKQHISILIEIKICNLVSITHFGKMKCTNLHFVIHMNTKGISILQPIFPPNINVIKKYISIHKLWFYLVIKNKSKFQHYLIRMVLQSKENNTLKIRIFTLLENMKIDLLNIPIKNHTFLQPVGYILDKAHPLLSFKALYKDLRSFLLRQMFIFVIVPMLNPDGVFSGNFRYDNLNQNLNRFYNNANIMEQPTIFATKTIIQKLANEKRLMYYFDIHAHHTPKGCYIYGNAFQDFIKQVQSKVFCRLMSLNSNQFQYSACNFSKLHMNYKERFDRYSKQGCGRVFAYKQNQMIHSFTVQCGYYKAIPHQKIQDSNKDFSINNLRRTQSSNNCKQIFTSQNFKEIGRNLMITILDSLELNPYSKIINSQFKDLFHIRKITSSEIFHQEERFRKFQINIAQKIRNVNAYIEELYEEWFASRKDFGLDGEFVRNKWPQCFKKLKIMNEKPKKQSQTNLRIIKLSKNLSTKQKQQKQQKQAEIVEPRISSELEEQKIQIQNIVAPGNNQLINFNFYDNSDSSLQKTIKKDPKKFYKKLSLTKNHKKTETAQFKSQGKFSVKTKLKTDADETQISSQFHIQLKQIKIQHKTDINNEINVSSKHAESLLNSKQIKTKRKSQLRNKKDNNSAPKKNPNLLQKQYKGTQYDDNIILRKRYENFKHLTEQNGIADSNNLIIKFPKIENLNSIKADIIRDLKKDNFCRNLYYRK